MEGRAGDSLIIGKAYKKFGPLMDGVDERRKLVYSYF
jgi:hypothetical protein